MDVNIRIDMAPVYRMPVDKQAAPEVGRHFYRELIFSCPHPAPPQIVSSTFSELLAAARKASTACSIG
jgi:hypothetical protein